MIYELRATLFLKDPKLARAAYLSLRGYASTAITINPGKDNAEVSAVELIQNNHDQSPSAPCILLEGVSTKNEMES